MEREVTLLASTCGLENKRQASGCDMVVMGSWDHQIDSLFLDIKKLTLSGQMTCPSRMEVKTHIAQQSLLPSASRLLLEATFPVSHLCAPFFRLWSIVLLQEAIRE